MTCVNQGCQHQKIEDQVDSHQGRHLDDNIPSSPPVIIDTTLANFKVFKWDWNIHIFKAMSQDFESSSFLDNFWGLNFGEEDEQEVEKEEAEKGFEGEAQREAGVESVGGADWVVWSPPVCCICEESLK